MRHEEAAMLLLAESIADGAPVDWEAAEARATDDERKVIRELRVLSSLAGLHRSLPAADASVPPSGRRGAAAPAIGNWAHLALVERLGGGTFGDVYRAWDRHLERDVALKLLRGNESTDDPQTSRIAAEGRLLARVRHTNVVTVHGVAVHDRRVGLWMELVRGVTLEQQLVAHGPFSAREAALTGIDLCRALAAIHAAGLIHRDVKAQNVMREDGGRIVLMDLGTGREADTGGRQSSSDLAGTPLYLAPEIFTGAPASERTDLYSLGVLLYHLVTGSFPVRATTFDELRAGHKSGSAVRLRDARADLPTAFVRVIDRATHKNPARRYESAGALEADLLRALDDAAPGGRLSRIARQRGWRTWPRMGVLAATLAATVVLGVAGWLVRGRFEASTAPGAIRSIAVLPLVNMSGDVSQEYFADGMTDELISALGHTGGLTVISRTSAMRFKGSKQTAPEIARSLHVDAVLEGSVAMLPASEAASQTDAARVRINARLIQAGTDTQLWDRTFERVVTDVLALQTEVAKAVADGINVQLAVRPRRQVNPQAYDAYLRARYLWNKRTLPDSRRAIEGFKAAIDADPTSALAWSGLADGYIVLASYDAERPRSARPLAKAAAVKALELDPSLAEAHAALANVAWTYDWNVNQAEKEFKQALALNPNYATAHGWYGLYLNQVGRFAEALEETRRSQELDPLSLVFEVNVARSHYFARQYDKALETLQELTRREPDYWIGHAILGQVHLAQGRFADAIGELDRARVLSPETPRNIGVLGDAYGRTGRRADALDLAAKLTAMSRSQYVSPVYSAMIQIGLGDQKRAVDLLEAAYADRSDWIMLLRVDPAFDPLRNDQRFQALLRRAANPNAP